MVVTRKDGGYILKKDKNNNTLYPTERVAYHSSRYENIDTIKYDGPLTEISSKEYLPWGIIGQKNEDLTTLSEDKTKGMGIISRENLRKLKKNSRIGYVHGMCTAIVECKTNMNGEVLIPLEMATGSKTTKMASCFPCTTYMYANGYPPSSIHLGRGESWVPPNSNYIRLEECEKGQLETACINKNTDPYLSMWRIRISNEIKAGIALMLKIEEIQENEKEDKEIEEISKIKDHLMDKSTLENIQLVNERITEIEKYIKNSNNSKDIVEIGNKTKEEIIASSISELFLDSLTHHKKDSERIKTVFKGLYDRFKEYKDKKFGEI